MCCSTMTIFSYGKLNNFSLTTPKNYYYFSIIDRMSKLDSEIKKKSKVFLSCKITFKHMGENFVFHAPLLPSGKHILYCSGGYYFPDSHGFIGTHAENYVASIKADVAIVGASGISLEKGITNPYPMHNNLQRAIIKSAKKCILLADHSKFERAAMEFTCPLSDIDTVITDSGINREVLEEYKKHINILVTDL